MLVGSDRAIPRALTNGEPIVVAEPKSKAARSYALLAEYLAVPALPVAASNDNGRRRLLLRKAS